MAKIITLTHQKGGVGKSTLAVNLANSFKENVRVAIIDMDPQGTVSQLTKMLDLDVYGHDTDIKSLDYDVIFVDTPPYMFDSLSNILSLSDLIIIPTKAGIADLMAIRATINFVKASTPKKSHQKVGIVLNMIKHGTSLTDEVREELTKFNIPIFKSFISDRVNFTRSLALKDGIYGIGDTKAEKEMDAITKEILLMMNT